MTIEELEAELAEVNERWVAAGEEWEQARRKVLVPPIFTDSTIADPYQLDTYQKAVEAASRKWCDAYAGHQRLTGMLDIARTTGLTDRGQLEMLWKLSKP